MPQASTHVSSSSRFSRAHAMALVLALAPVACDEQEESENALELRGYTTANTSVGVCEPPDDVIEIEPRRSLFESDEGVVSVFDLRELFEQLYESAGHTSSVAAALAPGLYDSIWETFDAGPGDDCVGPNGFPLAICQRNEATALPGDIDNWKAIAAVNRFDLAPADGSNCGEARIVFSNESSPRRAFVIFEAQIPNPDPECGVAACLPVQEFWAALSDQSNPGKRAEQLHAAFITGHPALEAEGFGPFMQASAFREGTGQIRTNTFITPLWNLREFEIGFGPSIGPAPQDGGKKPALGPAVLPPILPPIMPPTLHIETAPVAADIFRELWNPQDDWASGPKCRDQILDAIPGLLADDVSLMGVSVDEQCFSPESNVDFNTSERYAGQMSGTAFEAAIDARLDALGSELTATQLANRATFAGACEGCHQPGFQLDLGSSEGGPPLTAPQTNGFIHTEDNSFDDCGGTAPAGTCFRISPALNDEFLPSRQALLEDFLNAGPCCEDNTIDPTGVIDPTGIKPIDPTGIIPIDPQPALE